MSSGYGPGPSRGARYDYDDAQNAGGSSGRARGDGYRTSRDPRHRSPVLDYGGSDRHSNPRERSHHDDRHQPSYSSTRDRGSSSHQDRHGRDRYQDRRSRSPDVRRRDVPPPREDRGDRRSRSPPSRRDDVGRRDQRYERNHDDRPAKHAAPRGDGAHARADREARPAAGREVDGAEEEGDEPGALPEEDDQGDMMAMMGFGGFGTTKGKKVDDPSQLGYAKVKKERTWRQYMNRKGGFNRALEKI